jgi:5-oxopent-3-ene-1,2,5-tricarboxylate decarboxylase/2-hydroxyhepta-2,4-diene-1,7-dioate isomerase
MIYGVILNDQASRQKLGAALSEPPYKGEPKTPVLYLKPANTVVGNGATVCLPAGENEVEIGATIGLLIGREASRLSAATALESVTGYALVADLSLPHASYYRPAIREKCFDGACPVGEAVAVAKVPDIGAVALTIAVDGEVVATRSLGDLVRSPGRLLADVTEFMTLARGDMLLVGVAYQAPRAKAGSTVRISAAGLGALEFGLAARDTGAKA